MEACTHSVIPVMELFEFRTQAKFVNLKRNMYKYITSLLKLWSAADLVTQNIVPKECLLKELKSQLFLSDRGSGNEGVSCLLFLARTPLDR